MKAELQRRHSHTHRLEELFKSRPGAWISLAELAQIGGTGGYRTRISEMRLRKGDPMNIVHNGHNGAKSAHRYLPYVPLGPSAETRRDQLQLW